MGRVEALPKLPANLTKPSMRANLQDYAIQEVNDSLTVLNFSLRPFAAISASQCPATVFRVASGKRQAASGKRQAAYQS